MKFDNTLEVYIPKCSKPVLIDIEDWPLIRDGVYINRGYIYKSNKSGVSLHRLVLNLNKTQDKIYVDHINRDKLDNRKCNLRLCSNSQNAANSGKIITNGFKKTSSRFKGVSWDKLNWKWRVAIVQNRKKFELGRYKIEEEAARAYDKKAKELFGEFAYLNFPEKSV